MKKTVRTTILTLVCILALSFITSYFLLPLIRDKFNKKTYSLTNCLTSNITEDMDIYDIAKYYRDGFATVAVVCTGKNANSLESFSSQGSGVCIASNGYKTALSNGYIASKGSYIVTNHHVIDALFTDYLTDITLYIMTDDEKLYESELLWCNKNLDVAVLYCDSVNLNYVTMKDRSVESANKLDYEQIFTIGTPLSLDYINRLTVGNVASNNPMIFETAVTIYPVSESEYTLYPSIKNSRFPYTVMDNLYEDVVDIALGITNGNSGGGCFDSKGYLVGLTTLGVNVEDTQGNQMNGMVPIYPIIKVLDKLIDNNENNATHKIITFDEIKLYGTDANEAGVSKEIKEDRGSQYYYLNSRLYTSTYNGAFNFTSEGYYIIKNEGTLNLPANSVIISCQLNNGEEIKIEDRNDLIFFLLKINNGDTVKINYKNIVEKSLEVTF